MPNAPRLAASVLVLLACGLTAGGAAAPQSQGALVSVPSIITPLTVALAADRLMLERTYPPKPKVGLDLAVPVDIRILMAAAQSTNPAVRKAFVRALGRFEEPQDVDRIALYIGDIDRDVRVETMKALVQALVDATPEQNSHEIKLAFDVLRLTVQGARPNADLNDVDRSAALALESLGELPLDKPQAAEAVSIFARLIDRTPASRAAMNGLASLIRRNAETPVSAATRARLRALAVPRIRSHPDGPDPYLEALRVLYSMRDHDDQVINADAVYHCLLETERDPGNCWHVRYVAVQMIDGSSDVFSRALDRALRDISSDVRMAAIRVAGGAIVKTKTCAPVIDALGDRVPVVVLQAIDVLDSHCTEREDVVARLLSYVTELTDTTTVVKWQTGSHALVTLLKFDKDAAGRLANEIAALHGVWQVRAAAARIAGAISDEPLAEKLMTDEQPNVRTEALLSLAQMRSDKLVAAALAALESGDYQLVFTAASQLKRAALGELEVKQLGSTPQMPLMTALARLTADDKDTSRDPRVELLLRIGEYGDPTDTEAMYALRTYLKDVDPVVASTAADVIEKLAGERPAPAPTRRPIDQPTEDALVIALRPPPGKTNLVQVWLSNGSRIQFQLLKDEAPLAAYRFKKLADAGYYNGLTVHRVVPDLLIQAGSPGANEYSGNTRFWRDEIGAPHDAGAVALSTRGRHTGDAQFFVDLVDAPQFNHRYTVFGSGCVPNLVMEGQAITRIEVFAATAIGDPCK